jgi:hypothetical protein
LTQLILAINPKREITIKNNHVIIKSVFLKKRIAFYPQSEIIISDFEKNNENNLLYYRLVRYIVFNFLNINTNYTVLIKNNLFNRRVVADLDEDSALKLKEFILNNK